MLWAASGANAHSARVGAPGRVLAQPLHVVAGLPTRWLCRCRLLFVRTHDSMSNSENTTDIGLSRHIRPTSTTLRMFDRTELHTSGVVDLTVEHPQTRQPHRLEFYVAESHEQSI